MATTIQSDWVNSLIADGATPVVAKRDLVRNVATEVTCLINNGWTAFDSSLILKDGSQNHTLTLVLKIHLNPILSTSLLPKWFRLPYLDADKVSWLIRPWSQTEWTKFVHDFKRECIRWNDRFWLIPPAGYAGLDVKVGSKTVRPNVYCHLYISIVDRATNGHTSINVVNIDKDDAKTRKGLSEQDLKDGQFRSHSTLYGNYDAVATRQTSTPDNTGAVHNVRNFSTIAHEIGHSLGLPHIGVSQKDPLCSVAVLLDETLSSTAKQNLPALIADGSNANACYGHFAVPDRGANIMGGGTSFDSPNAAPWAARMALHTATKATDWSVVTRFADAAPVKI